MSEADDAKKMEDRIMSECIQAKAWFRKATAERLEAMPQGEEKLVVNGMFRAMLLWAAEIAIAEGMSEEVFLTSAKSAHGLSKIALAELKKATEKMT